MVDSTTEQRRATPLVSVVMPVYNGERYLEKSVRSVLEQTFDDIELIVVDDGSTDNSPEILKQFAEEDPRVKIIRRANAGIVAALNDGLAAASGEYIARMDADDVSLPDRIETQVKFMNDNPDCIAVGTAMVNIDPDGDPIAVQHFPLTHEEIDAQLLRGVGGIAHPTSFIRSSAMDEAGGYRFKYQWVEDKDLWLRLAEIGRLANLPDVLLQYRLHLDSVGHRRNSEQSRLMRRLLAEAYRRRTEPGKTGTAAVDQTVPTDEADGEAQPDGDQDSSTQEDQQQSAPRSAARVASTDDPPKTVPAYRSVADVHAHWSNWALGEGNFHTATKHAWSAIRARPISLDYWPLLARCLLKIQQPTGVLRRLQQVVGGRRG